MASSIVERKSNLFGVPTPATVYTQAFASTPVAGDIVVVAVQKRDNVVTTPSGLGVTSWTKVFSRAMSSNNFNFDVWMGTGATSAGNLTITLASAKQVYVNTFLLREVGAALNVAVNTDWTTNNLAQGDHTTMLPGVPALEGHFQLALAGGSSNTVSYEWPATGSGSDWSFEPGADANLEIEHVAWRFGSGTSPGTASDIGLRALSGNLYKVVAILDFGITPGAVQHRSAAEAATRGVPALVDYRTQLEALARGNAPLRLDRGVVEVLTKTYTAAQLYGTYLEVLEPPLVIAPPTMGRHGWGLVVPGA